MSSCYAFVLNKMKVRGIYMGNNEKKLYDLQELLAVNGGPIPMSKSGIYFAVSSGIIPSVSIGRRRFVPSWYIDQLLMPPAESQGA